MSKILALLLIIYLLSRVFKHIGSICKTVTGDKQEQEYIRQQNKKRQQKTTVNPQNETQKKNIVVNDGEGEYVEFEEIKEKKA